MRLARGANDRLADTVRAHPDRFAGFAMLPTADPKAAADELERAVTKLGFKGAMVHGLTGGLFLDDRRFWPIFERAQRSTCRFTCIPAIPHPAVIDVYYKDYVEQYPTHPARRLGLHGRDRHPGYPSHSERRVRHLSAAEDHPRPPRRGPAVSAVADQHGAGARRGGAELVPRHILRAFLHHDERLLLRPGTALLHAWRWAWTGSCFRSITRLSRTPPARLGWSGCSSSAEDKAKILSGNAKRLLKM